MAQAGSQFTAEQILEAGRRAEADGRIDYAIQFYRHLTDHLPRAAETAAAREALARIAQRRAETMNGYAGGAAAGQNGHTYGQGASAHHAPGPATPAGYPAAGGADSAAPRAAYAMPDPASRGSGAHGAQPGIRVAPVGAAAVGAFELPPRRDGYRMGRWIARLTAGVGWLCIALGLIAEHIAAGTVTGMALTSSQRWPTLPNLPTTAEAGMPSA